MLGNIILIVLLSIIYRSSANPCKYVTSNRTFCTPEKVVYTCACSQNICEIFQTIDCINTTAYKFNNQLCDYECKIKSNKNNNNITTNEIIAIAVCGGIAFLSIIFLFVYYCVERRKLCCANKKELLEIKGLEQMSWKNEYADGYY